VSGHVLDRGQVSQIHAFDGGGVVVLSRDGVLADYLVTRDTAIALASARLLGADVELTLARTDEPAPAVDERLRYLAELDRSTRLERALADAERTVRVLRAGHDDADALRAAIGREIRRAMTEAHVGESDAIRGAMSHVAERLRAVVDAQSPHRPAADSERVVIAEGTVGGFGPFDVDVRDTDGWLVSLHARRSDAELLAPLGALAGRRVRVVVEPVDAAECVGDQAGEGVGRGVGGEHRDESMAAAPDARQSRDGGAA